MRKEHPDALFNRILARDILPRRPIIQGQSDN